MKKYSEVRCPFITRAIVAGQSVGHVPPTKNTRNKAGKCGWALALALAACTSYTEADDAITIHSGLGGSVPISQAIYGGIADTGKSVVIDGPLHSTDAYFALGLPEKCYTENASFSLHAISYLGLIPSRKHTDRLASELPEPVEQWFRASGAYGDPIGWATLGGEELEQVWPEGAC